MKGVISSVRSLASVLAQYQDHWLKGEEQGEPSKPPSKAAADALRKSFLDYRASVFDLTEADLPEFVLAAVNVCFCEDRAAHPLNRLKAIEALSEPKTHAGLRYAAATLHTHLLKVPDPSVSVGAFQTNQREALPAAYRRYASTRSVQIDKPQCFTHATSSKHGSFLTLAFLLGGELMTMSSAIRDEQPVVTASLTKLGLPPEEIVDLRKIIGEAEQGLDFGAVNHRLKQLFFPTIEEADGYHLVTPTFPTGMQRQLVELIKRQRGSLGGEDEASDPKVHRFISTWNTRIGGTNPQNVSRMMSEVTGRLWHLHAQVPSFDQSRGERFAYRLVKSKALAVKPFGLKQLKTIRESELNNKRIRDWRRNVIRAGVSRCLRPYVALIDAPELLDGSVHPAARALIAGSTTELSVAEVAQAFCKAIVAACKTPLIDVELDIIREAVEEQIQELMK